MRNVLVIAYYFPPMGLSGVQRVAKFVKYLPRHGWRPVVLTVEPAGYFAYDETLHAEVEAAGADIHRTPSLDPTRLFGRRQLVALPTEARRRRWAALSSWLFVPDNKIGWYPFAIARGKRLLKTQPFDALFSSAPPYTGHLVGARLSRWSGLPLVVDFRDDWVGNPRHRYPTAAHRRVHHRLEGAVLRQSRHALTINKPIQQGLLARHTCPGWRPSVSVVPQGFDPADFSQPPAPRNDRRLRLLYTGVFYDAQTPDFFFRALAELVETTPEVRAKIEAVFVGLVPEASKRLALRLGIDDLIRYEGYLTHREAVAHQQAADVLWMTVGQRPGAETISTGKLFEYFGARKPILALVPEGAARTALDGHGAAYIADPEDTSAIGRALRACLDDWQAGTLPCPNEAFVAQYDRRVLAGHLAEALDGKVEKSRA